MKKSAIDLAPEKVYREAKVGPRSGAALEHFSHLTSS